MDEQVFKPLAMTNTQVANGPRSLEFIPGDADGFVYSDSLKIYIRADSQQTGWPTFLAGITGEGMIITTTGDLLKNGTVPSRIIACSQKQHSGKCFLSNPKTLSRKFPSVTE